MSNKDLIVTQLCSDEENSYVWGKLIEYNVAKIDQEYNNVFEKVNLTLRNEEQQVYGGLFGVFYWDCLRIDLLWIDEEFRKNGYGSKLLEEAENIARNKGCKHIELNTYSFHAPFFYIKNEFQIFGTLENVHGEHTRYYLVKRL